MPATIMCSDFGGFRCSPPKFTFLNGKGWSNWLQHTAGTFLFLFVFDKSIIFVHISVACFYIILDCFYIGLFLYIGCFYILD